MHSLKPFKWTSSSYTFGNVIYERVSNTIAAPNSCSSLHATAFKVRLRVIPRGAAVRLDFVSDKMLHKVCTPEPHKQY